MRHPGRILSIPIVMLLLAAVPGVGFMQGARDGATAQTPAANATLSVTGHAVLNDGTPPPPVRRARVTLMTDSLAPVQVTDTDTDGAFRFDRLPAGNFRILVEKPGFVLAERAPGRATVRPIAFALGAEAPVDVTIVMQRAAALEGQLLGDRGEPAANVVVSAVRILYGPYGRHPVVVRQATTDDLGRFRVHTLPSGDYYLEAAPDPQLAVTTTLPADRMGYARSYFPGTQRVDEARVLTLAPSQDLASLDFRIGAVRLAAVSGTIADASGRAPGSFGYRLQRVGAPAGEVRGLSPRASEFLFPAVPPGDYWLLGSVRPSAGADAEYGATRITVAGEDLKGLTVATVKGAPLTGRVEVESGAALPPNLRALAIETEFELPPAPQPPASGTVPVSGSVAADGTFTFTGVFGPRLFRIEPLPPTWALKSVLLDGADVTDTPMDFAGTPQPRSLRLVLTSRTASVSGSLEAPAGGPAAGRMIVFSQDPRRWGLRSRLIKTVEVQADGRYSIAGLPAGRYFIIGVDELDENAWLDPEVLSRLQATATPLGLAEGQGLTLTLVRR